MERTKRKNTLWAVTGTLGLMVLLLLIFSSNSFAANVGDIVRMYKAYSWKQTPNTLLYYGIDSTSIVGYCLESDLIAPQSESGYSFKDRYDMVSYTLRQEMKTTKYKTNATYKQTIDNLRKTYRANPNPVKGSPYVYVKGAAVRANNNTTVKNRIANNDGSIRLVLTRSNPLLTVSEFKSITGYKKDLSLLEYKLATQQAVYTLASGKRFNSYETTKLPSNVSAQEIKEVTAILLSGIDCYTNYENDQKLRSELGIDFNKYDKGLVNAEITFNEKNASIVKNDDGSLQKDYSVTYFGKNLINVNIVVSNKNNAYINGTQENVSIIYNNKASDKQTIPVKPGETISFSVKVTNPSEFGQLNDMVTLTTSYKKLDDVIYAKAERGYGGYIPEGKYSNKITYNKLNWKNATIIGSATWDKSLGDDYWYGATRIQDLVIPSATNIPFEKKVSFEWKAETGEITIYKKDENNQDLTGAVFKLTALNSEKKDLSGADFSKVELIPAGTDKEKGVVKFTNKEGLNSLVISKLPLGEYIITEEYGPSGYISSSETKYVKFDGLNNKAEVTITNQKIVMDLSLEKWVDNVQEENGTKTYEKRNKYDSDVEKRAGNIYVKEGDIVTYTIRVFNHGNVGAKAEEITDTIANGLEFIEDNEINKKFGWYVGEDGKVHTEYLKNETLTSHINTSTAGTAHNGLNYHSSDTTKEAVSCDTCNCLDVQISFRVKNLDNITKIINVAEITKYSCPLYDNKAEWTKTYKDETTGETVEKPYKAEDIDSTVANHPDNHDFESDANSKENGRNEGDYYREDDEDIAVVIPQRFDLSLEKWVSQVVRKDSGGTEKNVYTNGKNTDDNNVESRPGDIKVRSGDTVIYTIRVYNQGNIDGYVQEVIDSAPEGLEFINPSNTDETATGVGYDTNKLYLWEVSDGVLKSTFLSKENEKVTKVEDATTEENKEETAVEGTENKENAEESTTEEEAKEPTFIEIMKEKGLIAAVAATADATKPENEQSAFYKMYKDGTKLVAHEAGTSHIGYNYNKGENEATSCEKCAYKDIQIAFKVSTDANSKADKDGRIINLAQINKALSEAYEKTGNDQVKFEEIKDIDSTPGNHGNFNEGETREDDEDIAVIIPEPFDLALQKWITSYVKTVDGQSETVTTTQDHNSTLAEKSGDKLVKIDLDYKKLSTTSIKINYAIRVENEGDIPGYVKELTDWLPHGTEFYVEDNLDENGKPNWVLDVDTLKTSEGYEDEMNILMNPGDSQVFYLTLRWITGEENTDLKTNNVEISEDYNEWNTPDKDSTPGNMLERIWEPEKWEDEEDAVPFLLTIRTGEWMIRFGIIVGILAVALVGLIILRKKLANRV